MIEHETLAEGVEIYCGDCLEVLPTLAAGSVDAVVTDPPWGLGFQYGNGKDVAKFCPDDYWDWYRPRYLEVLRSLRLGGLMAFWQPHQYLRYAWDWYGDQIHIFAATKTFVQIRKTLPFTYAWEPVIMFYKPGATYLRPDKPQRSLDWSEGQTNPSLYKGLSDVPDHPCPRPLNQTSGIVANFTIASGIILDPFMGSGTTGVACIQTKRRFIGIEIDKGYYEIAKQRLLKALMLPHVEKRGDGAYIRTMF